MIVVDNLIQSFALDLPNGIPIRPFFQDPNDKELHALADLLEKCKQYKNCKEFLLNTFNLGSLYDYLK